MIRVGFDASKYSGYAPEQFHAIAPVDLASQAQDRRPRPPDAIIATPFTYTVDFHHGQVLSTDSHLPITSHLDWSSDINRQTSHATLEINGLLRDPAHYNSAGVCAYAWISPPDPGRYPESRVVIGVSRFDRETETASVKNYGGLYVNLSETDCQNLARRLTSTRPFVNCSDIRRAAIPIALPEDTEPWDYLSALFPPHPTLWRSISSGQLDRDYAETVAQAEDIVSTIAIAHLGLTESLDAHISLDAETRMQRAVGYAFVAAVYDCDRVFSLQTLTTTNGLEYKFVRNCGQCGTNISSYICKGYQCKSCGGIYEARC